MSVKVRFEGVTEVMGLLQLLNGEARASIQNVVNKTSIDVQRDAKKFCPWKTGLLRSSIKLDFVQAGLTGEVSTDVEYGPHVEFGTSKMPARPFLTRAAELHREAYLQALSKALQAL